MLKFLIPWFPMLTKMEQMRVNGKRVFFSNIQNMTGHMARGR